MSRLSQWSRRKLKDPSVVDGAPPDATAASDAALDTQRAPAAPIASSDAEPCHSEVDTAAAPEHDAQHGASIADATSDADVELPPPESLAPGSDIRAYLASGVDRALKKRALRQLFRGERYNLRDGLDDYDDDFRAKLTPLPSETAQRLRRWWDNVDDEEAAEDSVADSAGETPDALSDTPPEHSDQGDGASDEDVADTTTTPSPLPDDATTSEAMTQAGERGVCHTSASAKAGRAAPAAGRALAASEEDPEGPGPTSS
ncbi:MULTISPECIES: DUF3306 domain-containing protein [unclassified Halomonas]|jgi:hypothetical protein|uniref:DUF3306 domain-containing protein n=1 Tax=unclassified Halomonas TaxID=2609666 RepID=UPI000695F928|nr:MULTISPECIES: DUF3306 domain-containing protein [unclassified Halomonas]MCO7217377.1 DUF3306 domain-containing protein [Halomonas sp. OfavH-34-E]